MGDLPIIRGVFVCECEEVGGTSTAVTHHHRDRGRVSDVLQNRPDGVGPTLQHHTDDRHTATTHTIGWNREDTEDRYMTCIAV